jgi:hypothetical protein
MLFHLRGSRNWLGYTGRLQEMGSLGPTEEGEGLDLRVA